MIKKIQKNLKNYNKSSAGFTALYAILVASLALSLGLAVANIALKESLLSSTTRESQFAFYAANSGIECARYWDGLGSFVDIDPGNTVINCNNIQINIVSEGAPEICGPCRFQIDFAPEPYCVDMEVTKDEIAPSSYRTTLIARGYNTCNIGHPRRVERGLGVRY